MQRIEMKFEEGLIREPCLEASEIQKAPPFRGEEWKVIKN